MSRLGARLERTPRGVPQSLNDSWPKRNRRSPPLTSSMYLIMQSLTDSLVDARDRYVQPGATILDVGCGQMPYYPLFAAVAADYAGSDLEPGPNVRFVCPAEQLAIPDESFDVALSTQMLEHVRDPVRAVAEIRRVLRPGGIALLSTHGVWPYHPVPNDYWRWTHEGLNALVEDAGGFDVLEIVPHRAGGACLATMLAHYVGELARHKPAWLNRLAAYLIAALNVAGIGADRLLARFAYPHEHALILNYLVIARRVA
jgi:SAM-dependent methyltransferase